MSRPLIPSDAKLPLSGRTELGNHHKMIRLRRFSDKIVEEQGKPDDYQKYLTIQRLQRERDALRSTMPPLRIVHSKSEESFKVINNAQ